MAALKRSSSRLHVHSTWIGLLLAGVLTAGCSGYFRPAVPEPPSGDPIALDYSSPEATLVTLALGLADKATTNGEFAYLGAFGDSTNAQTPGYHQFFDPNVVVLWQETFGRTAPSDWGLPLERNFYAYLIGLQGDPYEMAWAVNDSLPDPQPETNKVELNRKYQVDVISEDGNSRTIIAVGLAHLTFRLSASGEWLIVRWDDAVDPAFGLNPANPDHITLGARRLESQ